MCKDGTCEHDEKSHHHHESHGNNAMAVSATLHCLTGCSIGEVLGLIIGTVAGLSNGLTIAISVILAFIFGFSLSTLPLIRSGIGFGTAIGVVAAADTLSIATMEVVDSLVMLLIPNAMNAHLVDPLFWISMPTALTAAFFAALPVNKYLLNRNKGHALTMKLLGDHGHKH